MANGPVVYARLRCVREYAADGTTAQATRCHASFEHFRGLQHTNAQFLPVRHERNVIPGQQQMELLLQEVT